MLGAIIGDIVGSRFEGRPHKRKDFEFFHKTCHFTDDSVLTLATAYTLFKAQGNCADLTNSIIQNFQKFGKMYPHRGYGGGFKNWLYSENPQPYNSWGNGAAMRVSPCGFFGKDLEEVKLLSRLVTEVTHNHPEGLKGAEATAVAVFLAKIGKTIPEIKKYICENYYDINFTLDDIRSTYGFDVSCQGSVPQALEAFFESSSHEDTIRHAISIGGDADTLAAIAGGVAEAYYGIPKDLQKKAMPYLDDTFKNILNQAYKKLKIKMYFGSWLKYLF